jgi:hypothetical protein
VTDTLHKCVLCHKQDTTRMACVDCTERMRRQLLDLPEFYALAAGEYISSRQDAAGNAVSIGLSVAALDARSPREAIWALEAWELDWRETLSTFSTADAQLAQRKRKAERWAASESDDFTGVNLCGVVNFLLTHLDTSACEHPAIDEFAREVRVIHSRARIAAGEPPADVTIIECPADVERDGQIQACGMKLHLVNDHVDCPRCGSSWDFGRLVLVARSTGADIYRPGPLLAEHFGVSLRTLQRWRKEGLVRGKGASYHHGDIAAVLQGRTEMTTT